MHSSAQFYLAAGVRILGHLLGVFLHYFNPKVSRTSGERGFVPLYLQSSSSSSASSPLLMVFPLLLLLFNRLLQPLSLHGFVRLCFSLTLLSSLTLKECACCWLLGFLLRETAAAVFANPAFRERYIVLLLPCLRPPLLFPNPLFFSHVLRRCMQ